MPGIRTHPAEVPRKEFITQSSDTEAGADGEIVRFTDRELGLIALSLPKVINQQRRDLLPDILRDWGRTDLPGHLWQKPEPIQERRQRRLRLERVEADAKELNEALAALDEADRGKIIINTASPSERFPAGLSAPNIERASREFEATLAWLPKLAAAARDARLSCAPQKGPARNNVPYLVLLDLAEIFEWVTSHKAPRTWFKSDPDEEPRWFHEFAAAVWPVIFGSDHGLSNAMRTWNVDRKEYRDQSPLIKNLALRNPTWGICD